MNLKQSKAFVTQQLSIQSGGNFGLDGIPGWRTAFRQPIEAYIL
jgi:hypothetical protein